MGDLNMLGKYALLALVAAVPLAAAAGEAESPLKACRAEADDARRLACYDREVDRMGDAPSPAAAAPEMTAEERFGRSGRMDREAFDRERDQARQGELIATVTEIWTRSDGLMVMTLDNGQVWSQNAPDPFFRLKTGDKIKVQAAAMGSYLLSGPSKRSTRVTRTK